MWPAAVAILAIAVVATGLYAFVKTDDLARTAQGLAAANGTIAERDASLASAARRTSSLEASLAASDAALASEKACTAALEDYSRDLDRLGMLNADRFNSVARGSEYDKANQARSTALSDAAAYWRQSTVSVANSNYSSALTYAKKAVAAEKKAAKALKAIDAAVTKVNDATRTADVQRGILDDQWQRTQAACGFGAQVPGSSG